MGNEHKSDQQKCLALLVFVSILWASEAVPLWVTSLTIPLMIVMCDIILQHDQGISTATFF